MSSLTSVKELWAVREHIPVALMHASRASSRQPVSGKLYKYDISLSLSDMSDLVGTVKHKLHELGYCVKYAPTTGVASASNLLPGFDFQVCSFGHAGMHIRSVAIFSFG